MMHVPMHWRMNVREHSAVPMDKYIAAHVQRACGGGERRCDDCEEHAQRGNTEKGWRAMGDAEEAPRG